MCECGRWGEIGTTLNLMKHLGGGWSWKCVHMNLGDGVEFE